MTPNHRPPACLKLPAALEAPRPDTCSPQYMRSAARRCLLIALSCAIGLGITGCKPFGTRPEAGVDPDDWAPPNRNSYSMPHQFQSKYKSKNEPSKVTKPAASGESATAKATDKAATETKKADAGITTSAKKEELPNSKAAANTAPVDTGVSEVDTESALANLPPHLQEVLRNQIAAIEARKNSDIKNQDVAAKPPAALASISSTTPSETPAAKETTTPAAATTPSPAPTALPSPVQLASNTEPAAKAAPVRMSLSDSAADTPSPQLTVPPLPPAVQPANATSLLAETQKAFHAESSVVPAVETAPASKIESQPAVTTASIVEPQPINAMEWGEAVRVAASSLEKKLAENPSMDERVRLNYELALRMIHLANNDLEQALKPIDHLQPAEQEYYRYQLQALYDSGNPEGIPVASRRWALVMENQRKANQHLSSISNLEVRNAGFCTDVQGYGVVTKFQSTMFKPDQDVLLYCELENVSAEQIRNGFETQLQGSYEIVDSQGRRVAEQLLPMEKEICSNQRRDYFVAYRVFMPMQIAAGNYEMRVTIEDMKGKKYGQSNLPFQIQK